jgi:hypothetical protein
MHLSEELHPIQVASYARMTPTQKHHLLVRMIERTRALAEVGIRQRHPDWRDGQVKDELRRMVRHGDA